MVRRFEFVKWEVWKTQKTTQTRSWDGKEETEHLQLPASKELGNLARKLRLASVLRLAGRVVEEGGVY